MGDTALKILLGLAHFFWPKRFVGEHDDSINWRRWHTTFDWIVCLALILFVLMATGHLKAVSGFHGFATADAQDQTASDVGDILDDALRTRADKLKTEICRAEHDRAVNDLADAGKDAVMMDRDPRELQDVEIRWRKRHDWKPYPFELSCDEIVL